MCVEVSSDVATIFGRVLPQSRGKWGLVTCGSFRVWGSSYPIKSEDIWTNSSHGNSLLVAHKASPVTWITNLYYCISTVEQGLLTSTRQTHTLSTMHTHYHVLLCFSYVTPWKCASFFSRLSWRRLRRPHSSSSFSILWVEEKREEQPSLILLMMQPSKWMPMLHLCHSPISLQHRWSVTLTIIYKRVLVLLTYEYALITTT